jgi:predicted DNA-binding transcriptional regulator AlpA
MADIRIYRIVTKMTVVECCEKLGISRSTWYNRVAEVE